MITVTVHSAGSDFSSGYIVARYFCFALVVFNIFLMPVRTLWSCQRDVFVVSKRNGVECVADVK